MTNHPRPVVTIDGLAGTGKSSIALLLAQKLSFQHLNTGLIYRSVAFVANENNLDAANGAAIKDAIINAHITIEADKDGQSQLVLGDGRQFYYKDLQSEAISALASKVAALPEVRSALVNLQRDSYPGMALVAEGRDMGTVIFPDAQLKFYIEVPAQIRAERRYNQLLQSGSIQPEDQEEQKKTIYIDILARDERDTTRAIAPCIPAADAIIFDNSKLSLTQAVAELYHQASSRLTKMA